MSYDLWCYTPVEPNPPVRSDLFEGGCCIDSKFTFGPSWRNSPWAILSPHLIFRSLCDRFTTGIKHSKMKSLSITPVQLTKDNPSLIAFPDLGCILIENPSGISKINPVGISARLYDGNTIVSSAWMYLPSVSSEKPL